MFGWEDARGVSRFLILLPDSDLVSESRRCGSLGVLFRTTGSVLTTSSLETFSVATTWVGVLPVSSGQRPEMLPNFLQCPGQPSPQRII